ncbi:MAG: lytic murein transglycosylase [Candidatus Liptonbacteria bacterium]|nr:lytic murein transglycosylase [Candidatus Liptonbacteria bacterium]
MRYLRPKVLQDIGPKQQGRAFARLAHHVDLRPRSRWEKIRLGKPVRLALTVFAVVWFLFGTAIAPTTPMHVAAAVDEEERKVLEAQLQELEGQIDQYEEQIVGYQKQGGTLKNEIATLNSKIAKLNLQIQAITLTLRQLDQKITDTKFQIKSTESSLESRRDALGALVRNLHTAEGESLLAVFLKNPRLSDFFADLNGVLVLQNSMRIAIEQMTDLRSQLADQQDQLLVARADAQTANAYQAAQKRAVDNAKKEKGQLLAVTKGQESKYQTLLKQTKEDAAKIRSRIFQLLGGGELSFEEAYQYAKLASGATGVSPALILAVLDRESALGQNVGRCTYATAMSPSNRPIFLRITEELGLNPDVMTVSCPNRDGAYGGAMGPAQFIPSTWNLYKNQVAKVTGHSPASPWNSADAFVATALYLKDAGGATSSVSAQRTAAARYYGGSNWRRYLWTYGEAVVSRAQQFAEDITAITS